VKRLFFLFVFYMSHAHRQRQRLPAAVTVRIQVESPDERKNRTALETLAWSVSLPEGS
jgi:hypothetical protein